ncbi:hypothetical protein BKA69DRAFT_506383 [Paraphysoderma sedebokerense]|nr:hypothetical protein BKA69DRAFT_506383 [Paraphysoderma sedebokerense]
MDELTWRLEEEFVPFNFTLLLASFCAICLNITLFIQFYRFREDLKTYHIPLISACSSDLFLGIFSFVFYLAHQLQSELNWYWCQFSGVVLITPLAASLLSLCFVAIERYLHIVHSRSLQRKHAFFVLVYIWISALFFGFYPIITKTYHTPKPSQTYCAPDWRQKSVAQLIYSSCGLLFGGVAITLNAAAYFLIYRKAIADGFKWNDESFIKEKDTGKQFKKTFSDAKRESNKIINSSQVSGPPTSYRPASNASAIGRDAKAKQIQLTKKLAILTFWEYLGTILLPVK